MLYFVMLTTCSKVFQQTDPSQSPTQLFVSQLSSSAQPALCKHSNARQASTKLSLVNLIMPIDSLIMPIDSLIHLFLSVSYPET